MLGLSGLPAGCGLKRPPLAGLGTPGSQAAYQLHYRPIPPATAPDPESVSEDIAKLRALGYIGATESASSTATGSTRTAGSYNNEGLILRSNGKDIEAVSAWETALTIDPSLASASWNLSNFLHREKRELNRSDELLVSSFANGLPEGIKYVIGRAIGYQRSGQLDRTITLLDSAVAVKPDDTELRLFRGRYRVDQGDCNGALEDFLVVQQLAPRNPIAFASAGIAEVCLGNVPAAASYFRLSLEIDPNQPRVRAYLQSLQ